MKRYKAEIIIDGPEDYASTIQYYLWKYADEVALPEECSTFSVDVEEMK